MQKQKPIVIAREEFALNLMKLIDESGLPLCFVKDVLNLTVAEVTSKAAQELQIAQQVWARSQEEEKEDKDGNATPILDKESKNPKN